MRKNGFFLLVPLPLLLQACGSGVPESDGMLTLQGNEPVVIRDPEKQKALCEAQYCEPNYLLYANFAKKRPPSVLNRPEPQAPTPVPEVDQAPVVPPAFLEDSDLYDYAKERLKVREAWAFGEGESVVVADIDSGIDLTHPDLMSNLWRNPGESESNPGTDHDGNGLPNDVHGFDFYAGKGSPTDENGHGTHTAGTIGALRNGKGVIGVAPRVKIMALRFLGPEGQGTTEGAIRAIRYAVRMGARVISASWGGSGFSSLLAQAVSEAVDAGVVFVAAAGNEGRDMDRLPVYPAAYPGAIAVAATDPFDRLTSFSNYGAGNVWIAAPGERIVSTYPGGAYASLSGTSMATPHVAGAVALKLGQNRSLTPAAVKTLLCSSADRAGINGTRCGRMNVARLLAN
jgi:subtilisin family serine protease